MQKIQVIITLTPNPENFDVAERDIHSMAQWFAGAIVASDEFAEMQKDDSQAIVTYNVAGI